jgi:hypothetical protein
MDKEAKEKQDFDDIINENRVKNWIYWYLVGDEKLDRGDENRVIKREETHGNELPRRDHRRYDSRKIARYILLISIYTI